MTYGPAPPSGVARFGSFLKRAAFAAEKMMSLIPCDDDGHVESVVYFLTEALRAAVESGDSVQQSLCQEPQLGPGMTCGEIAERLALHRKHLRAIWSYEVLLVAKIMRARELAKELRVLEPELRHELDTFRLATVSCADLKELLMPSAQTAFNGADQPASVFDSFNGMRFEGMRGDAFSGYRIAGHTDIRLLLRACEMLHFSLAARYGEDQAPMHGYGDGDKLVPARPDEEAFLLTDFYEVVPPESGAPAVTRSATLRN